MKVTQYFLWGWTMLVLAILTGCQADSEIFPEPQPVKGVIAIEPQSALENEEPSVFDGNTKSNTDKTLVYTLEVWTREAEPRCMLHETLNGSMDEGVQFEITLIPGIYDFLFRADYGNGHYLTTNLKQVTIATDSYHPDAKNDAFPCVLKQVEWNGTPCNATLMRPLARINIHNTQAFDQPNSVSMIYDKLYTVYNVLTGEVSFPQQALTVSFPETTVGSTLIGEDFLFVPAEDVMSLSVSVGNITKTINDVPLKSNYSTNITNSF